jgi:cobalt-zinc-cadmium efflux system outer membrane protein
VTQAVTDLAADTEAAFYEVQAAQQALELRQTVVQSMVASAEAANQLRRAGNISDLNLATEQAQAEQSKLDLATAEAEVTLAKAKLNAMLGLQPSPTWSINSRLPDIGADPDLAQLEERAVKDRADLAALRVEGESAARTLGLTKWSWLSDAEAGVAAERDRDGGWEVGPSVSLPIPLFDQGQGARGHASAELRKIQQMHAAKLIEVRTDVRTSYTKLLAARARAERYRTVLLPLRHKIVEQSQLHYNGMFVGVFELLQARRDEVEAGRDYLDALKDYWVSRTDLAKAVGSSLPAGAVPASQPTTKQPAMESQEHHHN